MTDRIETLAALQGVIGKTPPAMDLKVIDHLDETALRWIGVSPLVLAALGKDGAVAVTLGGGRPGFAIAERNVLRLPLSALDDPALAKPGCAFGSLFLAPGIGETLRVNGRIAEIGEDAAIVAVEACYVHCAKALIRSDFWAAVPVETTFDSVADFAAESRFLALATMDTDGRADLSPKGDPAGCMARLDGDRLWFADRPGNRRVDSFRNILTQPRVAAALLIPGSDQLAVITGKARITADANARAAFAVRGKTPLLAIAVEELSIELRESRALAQAALWPAGPPSRDIDPAGMFAAHVRLNKDKGLGARLAGAVVSIPGLMQKGLDKDYKSNLY